MHASASGPTPPPVSAPTFARDVAPIVYTNCTTCHRPGQSAPFSLISYEDVQKHGAFIAKMTARRLMPPWHATPAEGFPEFRDDRRLSDRDLETLKSWVDAGMPAGDLKSAPNPPAFPEGWPLGKPDLVVFMPKPIDVPAEGPDLYRNTVLSVDLRKVNRVGTAPFEETHGHHCTQFKF